MTSIISDYIDSENRIYMHIYGVFIFIHCLCVVPMVKFRVKSTFCNIIINVYTKIVTVCSNNQIMKCDKTIYFQI